NSLAAASASKGISPSIQIAPNSLHAFVDLGDGGPLLPAVQFEIEWAVGFGPSTLSAAPHMLVELEVPLHIPAARFGISAAEQGAYSPEPAFWSSNLVKNDADPAASAALFSINPDGSTLIIGLSSLVPAPEAAFAGAGLLGALTFWRMWRRK